MTPPPRRLRFKASPLVLAVALGLLGPSALAEEDSESAPEPVISPSDAPDSSASDSTASDSTASDSSASDSSASDSSASS